MTKQKNLLSHARYVCQTLYMVYCDRLQADKLKEDCADRLLNL